MTDQAVAPFRGAVGSVAPGAATDSAPKLEAGYIALRPVGLADVEWLFDLETHPKNIQRFRLAGTTPSLRDYRVLLQKEILCQYLVVNLAREERLGLVYAYNADLAEGRASVAFVAHPDYTRDGPRGFIAGVFLFVDYLFAFFSLRKICGHAAAFNFVQFANRKDRSIDLSGMFAVEAVLPDHSYFAGQWWDQYIVVVNRDAWEAHLSVMLSQLHRDMAVQPSGSNMAEPHRDPRGHQASAETNCLQIGDTALRPVKSSDKSWIASLFLHPENRSSLRNSFTPSPDGMLTDRQLDALLWDGVICQFIIEERHNHLQLGVVTAHKAEWNSSLMAVHAVVEPSFHKDPVVEEGVRHFVKYLFDAWPLRQLYFEFAQGSPVLGVIERALTRDDRCLVQRAGTLHNWIKDEDTYRDLEIHRVSKDAWRANAGVRASLEEAGTF